MCPNCKQNAPVLMRGLASYCTVCGAARSPFSARAVNLAGQPSKIGGSVAKFLSWIILVVGISIGSFIMLLLQSIAPTMSLGYAFGAPIIFLSVCVWLVLFLSGRKLRSSGESAELNARMDAVWNLAVNRGGALTPIDISRSLNIVEKDADLLLTSMTKSFPDYVALEVDENGRLFYLFTLGQEKPKDRFGTKYRVETDGRVYAANVLSGVRLEDSDYALQEEADMEAQERRKPVKNNM